VVAIRGLGSCDLRALDATTGTTVWNIAGGSLSCVSSTDPVVVNGLLFHGTVSGVLVALHAATGATVDSDLVTPGRSNSSMSSVVVANGAVYAGRSGSTSPGYEAGFTAHHPWPRPTAPTGIPRPDAGQPSHP
jgi:outer membrane protein assembly factor BamB